MESIYFLLSAFLSCLGSLSKARALESLPLHVSRSIGIVFVQVVFGHLDCWDIIGEAFFVISRRQPHSRLPGLPVLSASSVVS